MGRIASGHCSGWGHVGPRSPPGSMASRLTALERGRRDSLNIVHIHGLQAEMSTVLEDALVRFSNVRSGSRNTMQPRRDQLRHPFGWGVAIFRSKVPLFRPAWPSPTT